MAKSLPNRLQVTTGQRPKKPRDACLSASPKSARCLTIDVEEYFHIEAAHRYIQRQDWPKLESRVEKSIDLLLAMFESHHVAATFFILGDVAKRHPLLAKKIAKAGHEIASHGFNHDRLHRLTPQTFREDVGAAKKLLEDQTGNRVVGYRAPTFSILPQTSWAIDELVGLGFTYDSSIFPVKHPAYGVPTAPLSPFRVQGPLKQTLLEVPPLVWRAGGRHVPVAGGGYFRLLPLWFMKRGLKQSFAEHRPAILYFHPSEFDPLIPKMPLSFIGKLRTYTGLKKAASKLNEIISEPVLWQTIASVLPELERGAQSQPIFSLGHAVKR